MFEVHDVIGVVKDLALLKEAFKFETIHTQQLTCLVVGESTAPVSLDSERFQSVPSGIRVHRQIVRKLNRDLHSESLAKWDVSGRKFRKIE
ncbi:MAG: hypothetical protein PW792_10625 [Acidobacteriaceae bacterium]|nr:hypothetical protein [Acidobacteriaceae bacterium]